MNTDITAPADNAPSAPTPPVAAPTPADNMTDAEHAIWLLEHNFIAATSNSVAPTADNTPTCPTCGGPALYPDAAGNCHYCYPQPPPPVAAPTTPQQAVADAAARRDCAFAAWDAAYYAGDWNSDKLYAIYADAHAALNALPDAEALYWDVRRAAAGLPTSTTTRA